MLLLRVMNYVPLWLLVLGVIAAVELYSVGLMLFCQKRWGPDRLNLNNEVAGFLFTAIGVLYAVLLAFVVIVVWEDYRNTHVAVGNEAKAVSDLTQLSYALPEPEGSSIRNLAADYANAVSQSEWATMARGMPSNTTTHALAHLTQAIFDLRADQLRDLALFQQGLRLLAVIEDNRNERLDNATGSVPSILWLALIGGGMITLAYPAFFGTSNLLAQTILTALLAGLVALILLPALMLDFPFTGHVAISPGAFETASQQMPPHPKEHPPIEPTEN